MATHPLRLGAGVDLAGLLNALHSLEEEEVNGTLVLNTCVPWVRILPAFVVRLGEGGGVLLITISSDVPPQHSLWRSSIFLLFFFILAGLAHPSPREFLTLIYSNAAEHMRSESCRM